MNTANQAPEEVKQAAPVQDSPAPEKKTGTIKNQNALLRYITILFAVAFLMVTLSLVISMRESRDTISELNQTSASALQNAEALQTENRELSDANRDLRDTVTDLEAELAEVQEAMAQLETEKAAAEKLAQDTAKAYELLLTAMDARQYGDMETFDQAMTDLEPLKDLLTGKAAERYSELVNVR